MRVIVVLISNEKMDEQTSKIIEKCIEQADADQNQKIYKLIYFLKSTSTYI